MADSPVGPEEGDRDDVRTYSPEELQRLTGNLRDLTADIHAGRYEERPLDVSVVLDLHRRLFEGVRSHAGRHRRRDFGQEYLTFGPNRSVHRAAVEKQFEAALHLAERKVRELQREGWSDEDAVAGLQVAAETHAELVRIHPFEDGNGRTSRAVMSVILVRLKLRPIPMEVPKGEYNECLNRYFRTKDLSPLIALLARLYPL